jgi:hypothetical protein
MMSSANLRLTFHSILTLLLGRGSGVERLLLRLVIVVLPDRCGTQDGPE